MHGHPINRPHTAGTPTRPSWTSSRVKFARRGRVESRGRSDVVLCSSRASWVWSVAVLTCRTDARYTVRSSRHVGYMTGQTPPAGTVRCHEVSLGRHGRVVHCCTALRPGSGGLPLGLNSPKPHRMLAMVPWWITAMIALGAAIVAAVASVRGQVYLRTGATNAMPNKRSNWSRRNCSRHKWSSALFPSHALARFQGCNCIPA
jgi:hypothetical protein